MAAFSLRTRIFFALSLVGLTSAGLIGFSLRSALVAGEETRFAREFEKARTELKAQIAEERSRLDAELLPLCAHDPNIDSALVGLASGDLGRRLVAIGYRVAETKKAHGFDGLSLLAGDGRLLGGDPIEGDSNPKAAGVVYDRKSDSLVASCSKKQDKSRVSLVARRRVLPLLARASEKLDLEFSWSENDDRRGGREHSRSIELPGLDGRTLHVSRSTSALEATLENLNYLIAVTALVSVFVALALSFFLTRAALRPLVAFSDRARKALSETPEPLPEEGGKELRAAAEAFNQTLGQLELLRKKLALSERRSARRDVAREVAHEIKNPLSPILGTVETLRRLKARGDEEFSNYFDEATTIVLQEVSRLREMVRAFSTYAALPEPSPKDLSLRAFVEEFLVLHRSEGVSVELAAPRGPARLVADDSELAIVLSNLLKNAKEALIETPNPRIDVDVWEEKEGTETICCLAVSDNGPGIPLELRARLFQPGTTNKSGGSGIGLALSAKIAAEHGGTLLAERPDSGGARFVLRLPQSGIRLVKAAGFPA